MASSGEEARLKFLRRKHVEKGLELCFDNELEDFQKLMEDPKIGLPVDPSRAPAGAKQEDSFLSEAACGNAVDVVRYLLQKGADPNFVGDQRRTPLHRALLNDAVDVVPLLLRAGADPRMLFPQPRDEEDPEIILFREWDVAEINGLQCCAAIKDILRAWSISATFEALRQRAQQKSVAQAEIAREQEVAEVSLKDSVARIAEKLSEAQKKCRETFVVREERIKLYDLAKGEGRPQQELTIQASLIEKTDAELSALRVTVAELEFKLKAEGTKLRAVAVERSGGLRFDYEGTIKDLEDSVTTAPRHPVLLVDAAAGTCLSLMTYRGVFMIRDVGNTHHMHPNQLKLALLSCIRFGRALVINMRDKDPLTTTEEVKASFESISPGLWRSILSRSIAEPQEYEKWLTDEFVEANPDFDKRCFQPMFREKFVFVLLTAEQFPHQEFLDQMYSVRIALPAE